MKNQIATSLTTLFGALLFTACGGADSDPTSQGDGPQGQVTELRSGVIAHQDGPDTSGSVKLLKDESEQRFVQLGSDFKSDFATGTVTLYFAKSDQNLDQQRTADPASVSALIAPLNKNGEQYHSLPSGVADEAFGYIVLWCNTAKVNFGVARLQ